MEGMRKLTAEDFCKITEKYGGRTNETVLLLLIAEAVSGMGQAEFDDLTNTKEYSMEAEDQLFVYGTEIVDTATGWEVTLDTPINSVRGSKLESFKLEFPTAGQLKHGPKNPRMKQEPWRTLAIIQGCSDLHMKDVMAMSIGDYFNVLSTFSSHVRDNLGGGS